MRILIYRDLAVRDRIQKQFDRTVEMLSAGNFRAADVRKMCSGGGALYRARLNDSDRLLFRLARWREETCILLLEIVYAHAYDSSRFLRGAVVDESKIEAVSKYIDDQMEHHKRVTFEDEYREFLRRHNVPFDERYVWD